MAVAIHEANRHDSKGASQVIEKLAYKFPCLVKILADGNYQGKLADWVMEKFGWIVERSFSWLENFRKQTVGYEFLAETAKTVVQIAFMQRKSRVRN